MRRAPPLRRFQFALEVAAVWFLRQVARVAPQDAFIRMSGAIGRLAMALPPARKRVLSNLARVAPEADAAAVLRGVGDNFGRTFVEYGLLDRIAADEARISIHGAEHLTGADQRPVILISAHFGNWEVARIAARRLGRETGLIYRAFNNPRFDHLAQSLIRVAGEPVLHKGRAGARALARHVKSGGAALILIDQRQTGAPLIPFLGEEAETATAPADLALRYGGALIPVRARRGADGLSFDVRFEAEIPHGHPHEMMAAANRAIEAWVREDPGQWFWLHRRWKLRPRGEALRAAAAERRP